MDIKKPAKRNILIDLIRSGSIIWIVCFWHLMDYKSIPVLKHSAFYFLTILLLGLLFIISGCCMSTYDFSRKKSIVTFFKKRFIRLYIPFLLTCFLFIPITQPVCFHSISDFLKAITLISPFTGKLPYTLWFAIVLLIYNALTPIICQGHWTWKLIKSALIGVFILFLVKLLNGDMRVFNYYLFYVTGLFIPQRTLNSCNIKLPENIQNAIGFLSYISMMLYFLHRPIYFAFFHYNIPTILTVIAMVAISYVVQYIYDKIIFRLGIH